MNTTNCPTTKNIPLKNTDLSSKTNQRCGYFYALPWAQLSVSTLVFQNDIKAPLLMPAEQSHPISGSVVRMCVRVDVSIRMGGSAATEPVTPE